jgi:hypothetical protein
MTKRGIFYAIDAIIGVALFVIMVSAGFVVLGGWAAPSYDDSALSVAGHDMLTILDVNGTLSDAVINDNVDTLKNFIDLMPSHMCVSILIYSVGDPPFYNLTSIGGVVANGCSNVTSQGVAIASRTFIPPGRSLHVAEAYVWYR